MKFVCLLLPFALFALFGDVVVAQDAGSDRAKNTVILDKIAVQNLGLVTELVEERDFETTVFAIGRVEEIPSQRSVVSSRIAGRVVGLEVHVGDTVKAGQVVARVETRQPGDPPPTIELTALQDGLVVDSHVRLGDPVEPEKDLLDVADRSRLWAVAKIPEPSAVGIGLGTKARLRIPALGSETIEATLERFAVDADREAGTVEGIFVLDNTEGKIQPGMRVEFSLITASRSNVLSVPRIAVQGSPTGRVVFVADFDLPNAYVRAPVVLGEQNEESVEVISGLFPGDEVVTTGSYALSFAGGGSGISLKEALDAAHGHEHAEDGSELSEADKGGKGKSAGEHDHETDLDHGNGLGGTLVMAWAILATLAALVMTQLWWKRR
jgi:multidrug efflux pump subunit AcrA (membrane-fusion protein)